MKLNKSTLEFIKTLASHVFAVNFISTYDKILNDGIKKKADKISRNGDRCRKFPKKDYDIRLMSVFFVHISGDSESDLKADANDNFQNIHHSTCSLVSSTYIMNGIQ